MMIRIKFQIAFIVTLAALITLAPDVRAVNTAENASLINPAAVVHIRAIQAAIFDENWYDAECLADEFARAEPNSPGHHLLRAAAIQARSFSSEEKYAEPQFKTHIKLADALLEKRLESCSRADSAVVFFFMGHCHSLGALWASKYGSFIGALRQGLKARNCYSAGLELDSGFIDLHAGLGTYRYWKSVKSGVLKLTGIFKNEKDTGIAQIRLAAKRSLFSQDAAKSALVWIMINEKNYAEAASLARELCQTYPQGKTFLWPLAECYSEMKQYPLAIETYLDLRERLLLDPGNHINLIRVDFEISRLAEKIDDRATIKLIAAGFDEYYRDTPESTQRLLHSKYFALGRL